jgi:hypothetical protein
MANDPKDISTTNTVAVVKTETVFEWIKDTAYLWAWLPIGLAVSAGLIFGYNQITGRAPVDELPVGVAGNLVIVVVAVALSVAEYRVLFPRIDTTKAGVPYWQVLAIYTIKVLLLWGNYWALSHG